jgi:glycosyltransferase involved in cell wall biosynthesis
VTDGVNGYLPAQGSDDEMAAALRALDSDGPRARAFGRAGHRHVREHFSHEAMLAAYDQLFRSLLETGVATSTRARHALD